MPEDWRDTNVHSGVQFAEDQAACGSAAVRVTAWETTAP